MMMNFIGCIRNFVFAEQVKRGKDTLLSRIIFSVIFAIFILFTWAGSKSLLSGVAKIVSTCVYGSSNTKVVRIGILCTSTSWLIYNFMVGSYAGCVCEVLTIISIISAIIVFDIIEPKKYMAKSNQTKTQ